MASNTKKSDTIRLNKSRAQGKSRKKQLEKKGTTRSTAELFAKADAAK
jgi:hypothetical protein